MKFRTSLTALSVLLTTTLVSAQTAQPLSLETLDKNSHAFDMLASMLAFQKGERYYDPMINMGPYRANKNLGAGTAAMRRSIPQNLSLPREGVASGVIAYVDRAYGAASAAHLKSVSEKLATSGQNPDAAFRTVLLKLDEAKKNNSGQNVALALIRELPSAVWKDAFNFYASILKDGPQSETQRDLEFTAFQRSLLPTPEERSLASATPTTQPRSGASALSPIPQLRPPTAVTGETEDIKQIRLLLSPAPTGSLTNAILPILFQRVSTQHDSLRLNITPR